MNIRKRIALLCAAAGLLASPVAAAVAAGGGSAPAATVRGPSAADGREAKRAAEATAARLAAKDIEDVPVTFTVRNTNRSRTGCKTDGGTYKVRGHLTAPRSVLARKERSVTLYQHGIAAGEWYWRLDVPGYHYAEEMAERGHASLTLDRLGYGASDRPHGFGLCIGGQADIAHQIVEQLRAGTYQAAQGEKPLPFSKVTLAGQSNGGQVVQIAAYSFRNADGLMIMDWTDRGLTPEANTRFFSALQSCMAGGRPSAGPGDPSGYVYYDLGTDEFLRGNFHDTEQKVLDAAAPHQNRHPCGDMTSQLDAVFTDLDQLDTIRVPTLLLYGDHDARVTGGTAQRKLLSGADTELITIRGAGHYTTMARSAPQIFDRIAAWLDAHGL